MISWKKTPEILELERKYYEITGEHADHYEDISYDEISPKEYAQYLKIAIRFKANLEDIVQ